MRAQNTAEPQAVRAREVYDRRAGPRLERTQCPSTCPAVAVVRANLRTPCGRFRELLGKCSLPRKVHRRHLVSCPTIRDLRNARLEAAADYGEPAARTGAHGTSVLP